MSACEKCWHDACSRQMLLGGSIADRYAEILQERKDSPCSEDEQKYGEHTCLGCGEPCSQCSCTEAVK